jgi:hypothetical protein
MDICIQYRLLMCCTLLIGVSFLTIVVLKDISRAVFFPAVDYATSEEDYLEHTGSISYNGNHVQNFI